ncbi:hypothetical protein SPHINGO361_140303 [Sphingomonas sp. EC-HK361]|nr:hypothetical protein SPHINGO361_140303 [Sphingomonas sp. EC-HK361]
MSDIGCPIGFYPEDFFDWTTHVVTLGSTKNEVIRLAAQWVGQ